MSVSYKNLKSARQWSATIGLSEEKFLSLAKSFQKSYVNIFGKEIWERQSDSSTASHLKTYEDLLFFLLFSLKSGLTYDALGFVFGMSGGNAKKVQSKSLRILKGSLLSLRVMPQRVFESVEQLESRISKGGKLIIDGQEQGIQRPQNQEDQQEMYSGKKKTHHKISGDK